MRILQVIPYFPPAYAFGGPVKAAYQVSRELARRGHEVVVYTTDAENPNSRLDTEPVKVVDGIKVHYIRNISLMSAEKLNLFITPQLISQCKQETKKFDVIHLHEYRTYQNIVVHHYAKKYSVPYFLQAHGSLPRVVAKQNLKRVYDVLFGYELLRDSWKVVALSQNEAEQYKSMGVSKEKIVIIPNGIDLSDYANPPPKGAFKKKFKIPKNEKIILYLGRIHKSKGIALLVKAYSQLIYRMKLKETMLVIAGPDDGYLYEARSLASFLGLSNSVLFTGFISAEDKLKALIDADVFVTPSFYGFPITFLEACAVGTPIVATTTGDYLEWINGNVGYMTPPSVEELVDAIHRILHDNELHEKFSRNCREIVKSRFSLEKIVDRLEQVYEQSRRRVP